MQRDIVNILKNILVKLDSHEFEKLILTKSGCISGVTSDGEVVGNFTPISTEGNCLIGYGNYIRGIGATELFGNDINITSTEAGLTNRPYGVNKILWSGVSLMLATHTYTLSESISAQPNGMVLVWSDYSNGATHDYNWNYTFIPKYHALNHSGGGVECLCGHASSLVTKYLYITDTTVVGNERNGNESFTLHGKKTNNRLVVLRYVIGV